MVWWLWSLLFGPLTTIVVVIRSRPDIGIITRQAIRRGTFTSVKDLVGAISRFIDGWNERCHPFLWTKTADEILPHINRQRTSDARH